MKFGVKAGDPKAKAARDTNSSGDWIRYFKDGETRMRFLEEMDNWTEYWSHWNVAKSRNFPCTGDRQTCPGCTSENERESRGSKKYLVNALTDGYVNLWMLPGSTFDDLDRYRDKSGGTIMDRDYTIVKFKKDDRTSYSVDREERDIIDLSSYESKKKDHQKMLMDAFVEVWGAPPGGEPEEAREQPQPVREEPKSWSETGSMSDRDGEPPFSQPQPQQDTAVEEDDQEISEDQLRAMSATQIKALFTQCGLEVPDTEDTTELADQLIAALG